MLDRMISAAAIEVYYALYPDKAMDLELMGRIIEALRRILSRE